MTGTLHLVSQRICRLSQSLSQKVAHPARMTWLPSDRLLVRDGSGYKKGDEFNFHTNCGGFKWGFGGAGSRFIL